MMLGMPPSSTSLLVFFIKNPSPLRHRNVEDEYKGNDLSSRLGLKFLLSLGGRFVCSISVMR